MISFRKKPAADARTLESVRIGAQVWMVTNFLPEGTSPTKDASWNEAKYGRLLFFREATAGAPAGWHLPASEEWEVLNAYLRASTNPMEVLMRQFRLVLFKERAEFWTATASSSGMYALVASTSRYSWDESKFEF